MLRLRALLGDQQGLGVPIQNSSLRFRDMEPTPGSIKECGQLEPMRCPNCATKIEVRHTGYPYFDCPDCGTAICVASAYLIKLRVLTAIVAFTLTYLLGLRGVLLVIVGAVASLVLASVATPIGVVVVPPMLERY